MYGLELFESFASGWQGPFTGERGGTYWISPSGKPSYDPPGEGEESAPKEDPKPDFESLAKQAANPDRAASVARVVEGKLDSLADGARSNDPVSQRRALAAWDDSAKALGSEGGRVRGLLGNILSGAVGATGKLVKYLASLPIQAASNTFKAIADLGVKAVKYGAKALGVVGLHLAGLAVGAAIAASPMLLPATIPFALKLLAAIPLAWVGKKVISKVSTEAGNIIDPQQTEFRRRGIQTRGLRDVNRQSETQFAEPVPTDQVALAGADGRRAAELLGDAKRKGMLTLYYLSRRAAKRLIDDPDRDTFFDEDELNVLAESLAATTGTANLLGRSRIRERAEQAELIEQGLREFGENDSFLAFVEPPPPIPPERAIGYFNSLVPSLNVDPSFIGIIRDKAFTMAVATDEILLNAVKGIISDTLTTGDTTGRIRDIQDLLEQAGVAPKNPAYAETVYRSNMMESYNQGAQEELEDPLMQSFFPVNEYLGIEDGRQRARHQKHFNKYYPSDVPFTEIRDSELGEYDGYNCRCTFRPVSKYEWRDLVANGAKLETEW